MDNLKWITILWVVVFHVASMFNTCGMPLGVSPGLAAFDLAGYFAYPWIMPLMFLLAGMGAKYALERRTTRDFLRDRVKRLLLPLLATLILIAPLLCAFTWWSIGASFSQMAEALPLPVVCLIALLAGMGPQWFLPVLFLYTLLLLPVRRLDLGRRWGWPGLAVTALLFWLASRLLPGPDRFLAYFASFLMGYWVFSREDVLERLKGARWPLVAVAAAAFLLSLARYWGTSFSDPGFLSHPATALFAWSFCLAALGGAQVWLEKPHPFWTDRGFTLYLFHYLPMLVTAHFTSQWGWPALGRYAVTLGAALGIPLLLHPLLCRIPPLRKAFTLPPPK